MRALVQRVHWAQVEVDSRLVGRIEAGLLVYVGIGGDDKPADAEKLAEKVATLRIFPDQQGKLNLSVRDARGGILAVPNFTLMADASSGRRPSFSGAAAGEQARPLYETFVEALRRAGCATAEGVFGAEMKIRSEADGPVNIVIDLPQLRRT